MTEIVDDMLAFVLYKARLAGQSEKKLAAKYNITATAVRHAVARMLPIVDTSMRIQMHGLQIQRYEELLEVWMPLAKAGDSVATQMCAKLLDLQSSLLALNGSHRLDLQVVEQVSVPQLNTTEVIQQALDAVAGKVALIEGEVVRH